MKSTIKAVQEVVYGYALLLVTAKRLVQKTVLNQLKYCYPKSKPNSLGQAKTESSGCPPLGTYPKKGKFHFE